MLCFSLILTISPAARYRSWEVGFQYDHWAGFLIWLSVFALIFRLGKCYLPEHDPYLLPIGALLSGWGLLTIWRLDAYFGMRQSIWLVVCLFVIWRLLRVKNFLQVLRSYKYIWLVSGLLLTTLTYFFGTYPAGEGPHLWLGCCGIYFQPSEPLKLLFIVYLAAYLADQLPSGTSLVKLLTPTILLIGIALAILLSQHDLGTTSIFILLYFTIIFLVVGKRRILGLSVLAVAVVGIMGYRLYPIIRARIDILINPWADSTGKAYQIIQSLIAVATGSVFGRGIGIGNPGVIPVAHSDFIFSAIAEETGLVGTLALLILIAFIIWRGFTIALQASNHYRRYLAAGLTVYLALQSILIISGNLRLLPLTGITLPFVSYGGSSLLTSVISLLILLLISTQPEDEPAPLSRSQPYDLVQTVLLASLAAIALINGYWAFFQSGDLQTRADNPRLYISDLYVPRGEILDRNNNQLTFSEGSPGTYHRYQNYPALGQVIGFSSAKYGQTGMEAYLDPYLRGIKANSVFTIWINHVLYGESPPGLNVRLSLDLGLQKKVDDLLGDHSGSIVIMNAQTGEILAMGSHPYFNSNQLDENWAEWSKEDNAHLLNRATQGSYPAGSALGPFLLTAALQEKKLGLVPLNLSYQSNSASWNCAIAPSDMDLWGSIITAGCPGATNTLVESLEPGQVVKYLSLLGFDKSSDIGLPSAAPVSLNTTNLTSIIDPGSASTLVSPLQVAVAASTISSRGEKPVPALGLAVESPEEGWIIIHSPGNSPVFASENAITAMQMLAVKGLPLWASVSVSKTQDGYNTWYVGGTTPDWKASPLAFVVSIEENNPQLATRIGFELIKDFIELK